MKAKRDPVVRLIAKRVRLQAEFDAAARLAGHDDDRNDAVVDRFDRKIARLDGKIACAVATTPAGLIGQARVLRDICVGVNDRSDDCADRLLAAVEAGIERLAGSACLPSRSD